jgi:radical SAM protein with 4Fe4S-binding SPASM domain
MVQYMDLGLHLVVIEVTGRCNLSCSFCYRGKDSSIDISDTTRLLDQVADVEPYFINLSGGEPLIYKDVFKLAKKLKNYCHKLLLTTNGTLVEDYPKSFFEIFDYIQISIDGDERVHEQGRGQGNFKKAINAAKYLKGISSVSILCTIGSANYHQLKQVIQLAQESDAIPKIGRMCGYSYSNFAPVIDPSSWKNILAEASKYGVLNDDPLNFWFNEKKKSASRPNKIAGGCTAGIAGVAISPELDVYPCVKLRIPAGNLKEQSLKDIWLNSPLFASLRDWHNLKGHCPSCEYVSICRGCRADAWARTGDYLAPDPLCWLNGRGEE